MPDRLSKTPSQVTVEDLLRVKRAERPQPEFWAGFEQELRQRQLAALVERKPWWNGLSASASRFGWLRLPVGATAVLALTLLSVRQYSFTAGQPSVALGRKAIPGATASATRNAVGHAPAAGASVQSAVAEESTTPRELESKGSVSGAPEAASHEVVALASSRGKFDYAESSSTQDPLPSRFAIQLTAADAGEPALVVPTALPIGFEDRSISTLRSRRTAEMLPTAVAMTEQPRTHLLAALGSAGSYAPEPSAPEHAKRSVIRYLAEDGWDRSMSRLQADGDRLSFRF
jgi:hypothetical protein